MSRLAELQRDLQSAAAAVAHAERTLAAHPNVPSVLATLRTAVGDATRGELGAAVRDCGTQESFARRMQEVAGDSGFMLFFEMDHGAWLKTFGVRRKIVRWVFGD